MVVMPMQVPPRFMRLFHACAEAGGRALVVGGAVRDHCRGEKPKDLDVEVHGLDPGVLEAVLKALGRVGEVGRSFGVYKLRLGGDEVDVSVPRRDRVGDGPGRGHKGIQAEADPFLGVKEAARRRDLTINAIAFDPLTGVYEDPWGGIQDIERGILRAVDAATFVEDPLRALRVAQFAGRFGYAVAPDLLALCATMRLTELPSERVWGEVEKLLSRSPRPSIGWAVAQAAGMWAQVVPEWAARVPSSAVDPAVVPPLDPVRAGVGALLDRVAAVPVDGAQRRLALLLAAACAGLSVEQAESALVRLNVQRIDGYRVRLQVLALVGESRRVPATDSEILRAADRCDVELLARLVDSETLLVRAAALGVLRQPLPALVRGSDLLALGYTPGPAMGEVLAALREEQLAGRVTTSEQAITWVRGRG